MKCLRQSTAATIKLGPFLDDATGKDAEAALSPAVKLSKNGGALAARDSATPVAHDADGYYAVELDATDTGTIGRLRVAATATGALPVWDDFAVLHASVYDWLFGDAAPSTATPLDAAGVRGALGMATADLDTQLDAILADTAEIGAAGAGLTAIPWNSAWDAEVQSECSDALTAYSVVATTDLPTNFSDLAIAATTGVVDANLASVDSGLTASAADLADAVLSRAASNVDATADAHSLYTVIQSVSNWSTSASAGNLVIYKTDGVTAHVTIPLDSSASFEAIVSAGAS